MIGAVADFLFGWAGISVLVGIGCALVAIFLPPWLGFISNLRQIAILGALAAFGFTFIQGWGYSNGYAQCKAQWSAAELAAQQAGRNARSDAERDAARGVPDKFDRDDN